MRGIGRMLAEAGYRAVLVDLRGHGRSSGDWLTYGVVDSNDLTQVLDHLDSVDLLDEPVGLFGCLYGGAVALQLAARDAQVKSVVTVATFTSLDDAVGSSARQFAPGWMITPAMIASAVEEAGNIGHFRASQASPLLAITRTQARVLLIHGTEDRKLPCSFSQALHAAAKDHSQLILVQGADHNSIMRETTGPLWGPIIAWLAKETT